MNLLESSPKLRSFILSSVALSRWAAHTAPRTFSRRFRMRRKRSGDRPRCHSAGTFDGRTPLHRAQADPLSLLLPRIWPRLGSVPKADVNKDGETAFEEDNVRLAEQRE